MEEFKCTCGSWLEIRSGKFGPYFNCINCGNFNYNKGMEIKGITAGQGVKEQEVVVEKKKFDDLPSNKREITISSRDVDYFD